MKRSNKTAKLWEVDKPNPVSRSEKGGLGFLRGFGIASILGVIGFSPRFFPYHGLINKFKTKKTNMV